MKKLNIALIDDEKTSLSILSASITSLLNQYKVEYDLVQYFDIANVEKTILPLNYDLLFCDIEMPVIDGITLCKKYKEKHEDVTIIFISNREDLVFDSLTVNPFGFIRKKNFIQDISIVLKSYIETLNKEHKQKSFIVKYKGQITNIPINKIMYVESDKKDQKIYIADQKEPIIINSTMKEVVDVLEKEGFIITHKAFIVNYIYIKEILSDTIVLKDDREVMMSRRKIQEVKSRYLSLMKQDSNIIFRL